MTTEERRRIIAKSGAAKRASDRITFPKIYCDCQYPNRIMNKNSRHYNIAFCGDCKLLIREEK
jgi:hypothetical protein